MAATSKLIVFNDALRAIGSHPLADISTTNSRLTELNGAFSHAVEYVLAKKDWGFARRRSTLTGVSDSGFPPYVYRYAKPSDYLRKCWIKAAAPDEYQTDHAEVAAVFYGDAATALLEYVSDHADNYDPANWPPHFTRVLVFYLASLVAPKLARAGLDSVGGLLQQMDTALAEADAFEAVFLINGAIPANRQPVMRRALEMMGQVLAGSVPIHAHADKLRWAMNRSWDHTVKYILEQGAWNFATRRVLMTGGIEVVPGDTEGDIIEGYSLGPATDPDEDSPEADLAGWDYGYALPSDFLHKIWIKGDANHIDEVPHQFMRDLVFSNYEPIVMEYIASDDDSTDPGEWPATFLEAVASYLALSVAPELVIENDGKGRARVSATQIREKLEQMYVRKLSDARNKDAIQQYPQQLPRGNFVRARMGRTSLLARRYN